MIESLVEILIMMLVGIGIVIAAMFLVGLLVVFFRWLTDYM